MLGMVDVYDGLAVGAMALHVLASPFSKVEESFNTQALHDLAALPLSRLDDFDHMSFPGVVPRTFIGAVALTVLALPLRLLIAPLTSHRPTLLHLQVMYRLLLGLISVLSLGQLRRASVGKLGARPGRLMMGLFALCQFHLPFYCSRLLPNTYSLIACTLAHAYWLRVTNPPNSSSTPQLNQLTIGQAVPSAWGSHHSDGDFQVRHPRAPRSAGAPDAAGGGGTL